jgi:hypothetical protein
METLAGTADTVALLHSAHHAGCVQDHQCPVPLPADPSPPAKHMKDKIQQNKNLLEEVGTMP